MYYFFTKGDKISEYLSERFFFPWTVQYRGMRKFLNATDLDIIGSLER